MEDSAQHRQFRIGDRPDWVYLLQDFYEFYRRLPAGGSKSIRAHQRDVRERISRVLKANAPLHYLPQTERPVTAHLRRALSNGRSERFAGFIRTLEGMQEQLSWQFGYDKMPKGLDRKYAYAEIAGPSGPVLTNEVILGLVLFAPDTTYPAHAHDGITESYICLSGAVSENDHGVFGPGSLIFNPPGTTHRITTASREPSLLCYAWTGPQENLADYKMKFSRRTG